MGLKKVKNLSVPSVKSKTKKKKNLDQSVRENRAVGSSPFCAVSLGNGDRGREEELKGRP